MAHHCTGVFNGFFLGSKAAASSPKTSAEDGPGSSWAQLKMAPLAKWKWFVVLNWSDDTFLGLFSLFFHVSNISLLVFVTRSSCFKRWNCLLFLHQPNIWACELHFQCWLGSHWGNSCGKCKVSNHLLCCLNLSVAFSAVLLLWQGLLSLEPWTEWSETAAVALLAHPHLGFVCSAFQPPCLFCHHMTCLGPSEHVSWWSLSTSQRQKMEVLWHQHVFQKWHFFSDHCALFIAGGKTFECFKVIVGLKLMIVLKCWRNAHWMCQLCFQTRNLTWVLCILQWMSVSLLKSLQMRPAFAHLSFLQWEKGVFHQVSNMSVLLLARHDMCSGGGVMWSMS